MLSCTIASPKETVRHDDLKAVGLPALSGRIQILSGHAEAFIVLTKGSAFLESINGTTETLDIPEAECHVKNDHIIILL